MLWGLNKPFLSLQVFLSEIELNYTVSLHCLLNWINFLHPNISMHILHTVLCTFSYGTDNESLLNNQELFKLVIISFILMT